MARALAAPSIAIKMPEALAEAGDRGLGASSPKPGTHDLAGGKGGGGGGGACAASSPSLRVPVAGGAAGPAAGAAQAACTARTAPGGPPRQRELPRGDVMLIGGDLAYPNPTRETYEQRLFRPFEVWRGGE